MPRESGRLVLMEGGVLGADKYCSQRPRAGDYLANNLVVLSHGDLQSIQDVAER